MQTLTPQLAALLDAYKMPWAVRYGKGPTWNGTNIDISNATDTAWIAHELAHFLTTKSKKLPNWGIGTDPGGGAKSKRMLSKDVCSFDEDKALIGGVILLQHTDASQLEVRHHIDEYNIDVMEPQTAADAYSALPRFMKKLCTLTKLKQLVFFNMKK